MRTDYLRFPLALQLLVSGLFRLWHELKKGRRISGAKHNYTYTWLSCFCLGNHWHNFCLLLCYVKTFQVFGFFSNISYFQRFVWFFSIANSASLENFNTGSYKSNFQAFSYISAEGQRRRLRGSSHTLTTVSGSGLLAGLWLSHPENALKQEQSEVKMRTHVWGGRSPKIGSPYLYNWRRHKMNFSFL